MRICFPVENIPAGTMGGIEVYARNLVHSLQLVDSKNKYLLFCSSINEKIFPIFGSNFEKITSGKNKLFEQSKTSIVKTMARILQSGNSSPYVKLMKGVIRNTLKVTSPFSRSQERRNVRNYGCSIEHYLFNTIPHGISTDIPAVLTVVDIQHEFFPEFFSKEELEKRRDSYRFSIERANHIIVISEFTKLTLVQKYQIPEDKITVIHLGYDPETFRKLDREVVESFKKLHKLPSEFFFYPAATWPHKNHLNLIRAYKLTKDKYDMREKLILTGMKKQNFTVLKKEIKKLGLTEDVIHLGYLPYGHLPYMYNAASLLVFPSLFEGFGMPLIEAMATGLPVACSNRTSLPEVAGDAALLFNPESPEDIAEKIFVLISDHVLRKSLIRKGFERARSFTWKQTALKTVKVYEHMQIR